MGLYALPPGGGPVSPWRLFLRGGPG
jgi:hypothetical protein